MRTRDQARTEWMTELQMAQIVGEKLAKEKVKVLEARDEFEEDEFGVRTYPHSVKAKERILDKVQTRSIAKTANTQNAPLALLDEMRRGSSPPRRRGWRLHQLLSPVSPRWRMSPQKMLPPPLAAAGRIRMERSRSRRRARR